MSSYDPGSVEDYDGIRDERLVAHIAALEAANAELRAELNDASRAVTYWNEARQVAIEAEREACAKALESVGVDGPFAGAYRQAFAMGADVIRSRSKLAEGGRDERSNA